MPARLTGQLYIYPTHGLYVGPLIATARHQHHSGQITWAPDGLEVEVEDGGAQRVVTHLVPPHVPHCHGPAVRAAVVWLDRDNLRWDCARQASFDPPAGLCIDEPLEPETARELADALLALVAPGRDANARVALHPAVKRMCALLDANTTTPQLSLAALARQAGLSPRQLRHQFTQEIGINPSAYLRWRRLRRAAAAIESGATLTEGAIEGGFADGAHFSRVFHAQFGMTPSQAFSSVHFASRAVGSARDREA
jgi:AraC-like DNA-binding protein